MATKTIQVDPSHFGKIIGKGVRLGVHRQCPKLTTEPQGATIKDIQSDYGVTITIPDSGSTVTIQGPTNKSLTFAENRILDICGLRQDETDSIRDRVQQLYEKKDDLFKQAYAAPKGTSERDRLFDEANRAKDECEQAKKQAAQQIFALKNQGYGGKWTAHCSSALTVFESRR